jgi:flagellar hook-basal body complex protein FliE
LSPSQALANLNRPSSLTSGSAASEGKLDFQEVLKEAVRGVSDAQQTAQSKAQAYQLGDDKVSLEDVMISMQRANLAMQGMVQVRNRLVEAYREVINMQV